MSRKSTPDVLGEIMGSTNPESKRNVKQEKNKEIKQEYKKEVDTPEKKTVKEARNKETIKEKNNKTFQEWNNGTRQEGPKEKATFNLTVEALDLLEEAWVSLRKKKREAKITKSLIVERAIRSMLSDRSL